MPGTFRKMPPRPAPPPRATARPLTPRPALTRPVQAMRPPTPTIHRAINLNRLDQRTIRREEARKVAESISNRPRPAVRPGGPPLKVMPANQAPTAVQVKRVMQPRAAIRPSAPPAAQVKAGGQPPARPATPSAAQVRGVVQRRATAAARAAAPAAAATGAAILGALVLNKAAAHPDISPEVTSLQWDLENLEETSALTEVQTDIANLDKALKNATNLLESARDKGYRYQGDLEDLAYQALSQWEALRSQTETNRNRQAQVLQNRLTVIRPQVSSLNQVISNAAAATPLLQNTQTQVNSLLQEAGQIQGTIEGSYSAIETQAHQLNARLTQIHWALDQLAGARFQLESGEDLVMAVPARWDKEGKDDPEGVLYLSNRRLVFERKEKIATKKVLFITTATELVQEVLISQPLANLPAVKAANKGLFGHQDFLEVQFADPQLGEVAFHLNGQDSDAWATLVERARTGKIEDERASTAGLSYADLHKPLTPADLIALQNEVNELQDEVMLKAVRDELAKLENDVRSLERKLADVRARGYAIERDLEADFTILAAQWERVKKNAETTLEQQTHLLSEQMTSIQTLLSVVVSQSGNLTAARPQFMQTKSAIASAEAQADAAQATVLTQYDEYADEIEALGAHLDWIDWMLDALATASFRLLATESGIAAAEAVWLGTNPENGILFLTDQRLLWEDRVETYELKVDVPLQQVVEVKKATDEGNQQELLAFTFDAAAPFPESRFRLSLPVGETWLKMVGRARGGEYAQDRAVPLDEAELERVRNAPQQCSNCGAGLTAPILRGQLEIKCEYCGQVVRL